MYHLVDFLYCHCVLVRSAVIFHTLERFVDQLPVPLGGLSFDVYDRFGFCYGELIRVHPHSKCVFIKNRLYDTRFPKVLHFVEKSPDLDAYTRYLLDRWYPEYIDRDFVCFDSANSYIG